MNALDIRTRNLGVNFNRDGHANVLLWAPKADLVEIFLLKDDSRIPLQKKKYGYWSLETNAIEPGDEYLFILNEKDRFPDPASLAQPSGVHGASEAIDIKSYKWTDIEWKNIPLKDYITYEVHVGTFTDEGTFAAMIEKLDYLADLGITAVEIMPVAQFSGERNWGYDGVFPFSVQNSYGGAHGLQQLVDACHNKGLAVILDVVYNHIGPEGNHLENFAPYFTDKYNTPWGNAINFDDAWCDGVREYFSDNAMMWFRDFHIDALRMDAIHAIKDFGPVHILQEIKQDTDMLAQQTGRSHHLIVELDLNDTRFINPSDKGGFGMDAQWIDEFHHALRVSSGQPKTGYYSDFDAITSLAKSYEDAYVYDGAYSDHRKKKFGMKASENTGQQFVVFSQNHDHVGNRMLGERTSQLISAEMQKLLAGAVMASPYLPMLFMGEEYGETNPFQYFVSHTDPELAEAVRKGRKKEFEAFHVEGEAPDPMAEETFTNSKLQWDLINKEPHETMLGYYKKLISIRKEQPALSVLNRKDLSVESDEKQQTIILHRQYKMQEVICFMNFSNEPREVTASIYAPVWFKLIASSDIQWGGSDELPETIQEELKLTLPPESFTIYINQNE
ncbi:malto-oligosyltrehalose trehalohydrolase [Dyadobacter psychrotolerans]|uniref:Malto-oligosyltrehalose trehalohydrolase n=1 Tax=Dyadobacter psychrotolerans TaxID=2541721 RepID=A0A4R5DK14_9BACT|nr:malto-oligosyltrehalose trehalohydrolase [Dyadobacter psychrotolerans]TDE14482.1 malto-oligosyltrehalose trehalohydrolase [Dyadobacter psychrotolerans]